MNKIINITILTAFIFVAVFGVMGLAPDHQHEPGCPFMPGEQAICPMGLLEHITSWKNIFAVLLPSVLLILLLTSLAVNLKLYLLKLLFAFQRFKLQVPHFSLNLFQELFSQGILNPKAP